MKDINLKECELFLEIKDNSVLCSRGDYALGFKLCYPEKYSLSRDDLDNLYLTWHNMLKNLPLGTIVVKSDLFLKEHFSTREFPNRTYFQEVTNEYFSEREYVSHTGYIFFIFTGIESIRNSRIRNPFCLPNLKNIKAEDEKKIAFIESISQTKDLINRSDFLKMEELTEKEIISFYQFYFGGFNKNYLTDIEFDANYLKTEDKICGVMSITNEKNLPTSVSKYVKDTAFKTKDANFYFYRNNLDELGVTLNCNHIYNQIIFIDSHKEHVTNFQKVRDDLHGARGFSPENGAASERLKNYLQEVDNDPDFRYVRGNNSIIFWANDENEYKQIKNHINSIFINQDIKPYIPTKERLKNLIYNSFFANVSCLDDNSLYIADLRVAITYLLNNSNYRSDNEGILLNDRLWNIPVKFDFWDRKKRNLQSRNFMIIAPTGSGKSVTFQHLARQLLEDNVKQVIIDLGDSYVKYSKLLPPEKVAYFKYKEGQAIGLNPFASNGEITTDRVDEVCEFVWTLVKREQIPTEEEKTSLRRIVNSYYIASMAIGDINFHWFKFYHYVKDNQDTILHSLEIDPRYFDMKQFLHNGGEFLPGGSYYFLFDDEKEKAIADFVGKDLILFELMDVKDNKMLLNIMLLAISSAINKAIWNDRTNRGIVFFDEFAKQMEFPSVLDKVKFYSQAIRKQEGALGLILQTVNQLPDTPASKSIMDNTETYMFLNMNAKLYHDTVERLNLGEHIETQLNSMSNNYSAKRAYSELLIVRNKIHNVYRIELPKPIFYVYQTEGAIHEEMMRRYEIIKDMAEVVKQMIEENIIEK